MLLKAYAQAILTPDPFSPGTRHLTPDTIFLIP